jgi:mannose-6-phosphate isomerase
MRSVEGNGYELKVWQDEDVEEQIGPGLMYCVDGIFSLSNKYVGEGIAKELRGSFRLRGTGTVAVLNREGPLDQELFTRNVTKIIKPWGWEQIVSDEQGTVLLKRIVVAEGESTSLQYHEHKDEVQIALYGEGPQIFGVATESFLDPAHFREVHIKPNIVHRSTGPSDVFEASTFHPNDVVRLEDNYGR